MGSPTIVLPGYAVRAPARPGFTGGGPASHRLVMSAWSGASVSRIGYLVPTSADHSHGIAEVSGSRWSLQTYVTGRPDYALVFIQAGASGTPITCTITVDGVLRDRETTSGVYGRQVCKG